MNLFRRTYKFITAQKSRAIKALLFYEEKNEKMRQLTVTRINAYSRDYWSNRKVNSNIVIRKYGRVIGGGGEYTPGKGMRYMKCYEYLGKLYWLYV